MKNILLFLLLATPFYSNGQFTDRYWTFGECSASDFRNLNAPIPAQSVLRARGTCASICDSAIDLLFYTRSPNVEFWEHPGGTYNYGYIMNKKYIDNLRPQTINTSELAAGIYLIRIHSSNDSWGTQKLIIHH